jgi:ATP-binding cassette subfamily C protein CydD
MPLLLIAGLLILRGASAWLRGEAGFHAGARVRRRLRAELLEKLGGYDRERRAGHAGAALTSQLLEQVEALDGFFSCYLPQMGLALLAPISILAVVFPLNWTAGLILLITAPLIPLFMALVGMGAAALNRRNFRALSRLSAHYQDRLRGLATLRHYGLAEQQEGGIQAAAEGFRQRTMAVLRVAFLSSAVLEFFASVAIAVLAVYLGMSYLGYLDFGHYGEPITLKTGLFILLLAPEFYLPLRDLGAHYHDRAAAIGAAEELMPLFADAAGQDPAQASQPAAPAPEGELTIQLQGLEFGYQNANHSALSGLDLTLRPGERIALVGASGAGKSTLLALLLGQLRPQQGEIRINDLPLNRLDPASWHARLGWLGQHPYLFHASLRENLTMALDYGPGPSPEEGHQKSPSPPGERGWGEGEIAEFTDQQIHAALEQAGLSELIASLPQGLESRLGEQGHGLSGGQLRRLALARALLKQPALLLLDEPTAALDRQSELALIQRLQALPRSTGMLLLTHRPATLALADRILVLEAGRIVAQGERAKLDDPTAPITQRLIQEGLLDA